MLDIVRIEAIQIIKCYRLCTYKAIPLENKWVCADCSFEQIHLH